MAVLFHGDVSVEKRQKGRSQYFHGGSMHQLKQQFFLSMARRIRKVCTCGAQIEKCH